MTLFTMDRYAYTVVVTNMELTSYILPTIRHRLLMIPGDFVRLNNVPTLRFPRNTIYRDVIFDAQKKIKTLDPLL